MNKKLITTMLLVCAIAVPATASFDYAALQENQSNSNSWQLTASNLETTLPARSQQTYGSSSVYGRYNGDDDKVSSQDVVTVNHINGRSIGFPESGKLIVPGNGTWTEPPTVTPGNGESPSGPNPTPLPSSALLSLVGVGFVGLLRKRKTL